MDDLQTTNEALPESSRLTAVEARVVGCLVEKEMTTPENYPMSLNAVTLAANQRSNRDPVVDYSEASVERTLRDLTDGGVARMVHRPGDRVVKYRHALGEHLSVDDHQLALVAVLLLRGAQTPGELRQRTQRYVEFDSLSSVERTLDGLVERRLVRKLDRRPGQKESRYVELVSSAGSGLADVDQDAGERFAIDPVSPAEVSVSSDDLAALRTELEELRDRFEALLHQLGVDDV